MNSSSLLPIVQFDGSNEEFIKFYLDNISDAFMASFMVMIIVLFGRTCQKYFVISQISDNLIIVFGLSIFNNCQRRKRLRQRQLVTIFLTFSVRHRVAMRNVSDDVYNFTRNHPNFFRFGCQEVTVWTSQATAEIINYFSFLNEYVSGKYAKFRFIFITPTVKRCKINSQVEYQIIWDGKNAIKLKMG